MTTIEKLSKKHFDTFGESPEYGFWAWLDAVFAEPNEESLKRILNDPKYWENGGED
jgi:hypothetical protein